MSHVVMPVPAHEPGDVVHGFHVDAVTPLPSLRMVAYELTHNGSGARLVHLHCHDRENLFAIVLRTPPPDDTGLPHILEHTVLCGSRKFPVKDPFVELLKTSLATFLNAFTGPDHTAYPCASMNEKDFFNLVDVYCDAVFHPRITQQHFRQEGHHLSFEEPGDTTSPLTINGIVYNEMKGAFSGLDGVIWRELGRHLFPDNAYGRESGGDPDHIPNLTYDQFVAFHRAYYHPSNARIMVCGDIPTAKHLAFLDAHYLGKVTAQRVETAIGPQPRWTAPRSVTAPYAIGPDDDPARKAAVVVSFMLNPVTDVMTDMAMHILDYYLVGNAASPLRKALTDSGLGEELTPSGYCGHQRDTYFTVGLKGTEAVHADAIVSLVRDTLARVAREGMDCDKIESAFHQYELAAREQVCASPLHFLGLVSKGWLYDMPPLLHLRLDEHMDALRKQWQGEGDYFEKLIRTWFLDNPHYSVLTCVPDRDLTARTTRAFAERMAATKAGMDAETLQGIADEATALEDMQSAPNSPEALATLPRLSLADVPREPMDLPTVQTDVEGIPVLTTDVFCNGVNHIECSFNLAGLPDDLVDCLAVYAEAMKKMGAGSDDYAKTAEREAACSGGVYAQFSFDGRVDDQRLVQPILTVCCSAVDRKFDEMLALLKDKILSCGLDDRKRLRDVLLQRRTELRNAVVAGSSGYARRRAMRGHSANTALLERVHGLSSVNRIERLADNFAAEADALCNGLHRIAQFLQSKKRMTVSFVGGQPQQERMARWVADMARAMSNNGTHRLADEGSGASVREAVAIPSAVAAVAVAVDVSALPPEDMPVLFMLTTHLTYGYLWEGVRVLGGAYGVYAAFDMNNGLLTLSSSQDPHVKGTLDVFSATADYIANQMDLSSHGIEQALIGSFKKLDYPIRGGEACSSALARFLTGRTTAFRRVFRERLMAVTADDVRRVAHSVLAPGLRAASVCAMANREKLDAENALLGDAALPVCNVADVA